MKKIIACLALAAFLVAPAIATAQAPAKEAPKKECCKDKKECSKDKKECSKDGKKECCKKDEKKAETKK